MEGNVQVPVGGKMLDCFCLFEVMSYCLCHGIHHPEKPPIWRQYILGIFGSLFPFASKSRKSK